MQHLFRVSNFHRDHYLGGMSMRLDLIHSWWMNRIVTTGAYERYSETRMDKCCEGHVMYIYLFIFACVYEKN
jgi:hypothetical protein